MHKFKKQAEPVEFGFSREKRICKEGKDNFSNEELEDMVDLFKNKKSRKLEF